MFPFFSASTPSRKNSLAGEEANRRDREMNRAILPRTNPAAAFPPFEEPVHHALERGEENLLPRTSGVFSPAIGEQGTLLTERTMTPVPNRNERGALLLLEGQKRLATQYTQELQHIQQSIIAFKTTFTTFNTIPCLRACSISSFPMTEEATILLLVNANRWKTIKDIKERPLIFNKDDLGGMGENRVALFVREEGDNNSPVVPSIIPSGVMSHVHGRTYIAPDRIPSSEENKEVRNYIKESLKLCYRDRGTAAQQEIINNFQVHEEPMTVDMINQLIVALDAHAGDDRNIIVALDAHAGDDRNKEFDVLSKPFARRIVPPHVEASQDHLTTVQQRHGEDQEQTRILTKILTNDQQDLLKALWYSGETVVRAGGAVVGAGIVGVAGAGVAVAVAGVAVAGAVAVAVAVAGAAGIGVISGAFDGGIIGSVIASVGTLAVRNVYNTAEYFAPGVALAKAKEAFSHFMGDTLEASLQHLEAIQSQDQAAIATLTNLFQDPLVFDFYQSLQQEEAARISGHSSATAAAREEGKEVPEEKKSEELPNLTMAPPSTTQSSMQSDALISFITQHLEQRALLITYLQELIAQKKEEDRQARMKFFEKRLDPTKGFRGRGVL
jgi:hypothetical protein